MEKSLKASRRKHLEKMNDHQQAYQLLSRLKLTRAVKSKIIKKLLKISIDEWFINRIFLIFIGSMNFLMEFLKAMKFIQKHSESWTIDLEVKLSFLDHQRFSIPENTMSKIIMNSLMTIEEKEKLII